MDFISLRQIAVCTLVVDRFTKEEFYFMGFSRNKKFAYLCKTSRQHAIKAYTEYEVANLVLKTKEDNRDVVFTELEINFAITNNKGFLTKCHCGNKIYYKELNKKGG